MALLADRLKALGVKLGARDLPPPPRNPHRIEQVVPGRFQDTSYGPAFVVETRYPPDHRQGQYPIRLTTPLRAIGEWARQPPLAEVEPSGLVFLDTETTGLGGGTGTYAFMIGVGRYDGDSFLLAQYFMRDPVEEPAMLAALAHFLEPCRALVTFNGRGFDVPILKARYLTNGEMFPLASCAHLDLLSLARALWRDRLASRALGSLEEHILGAARTHEDVPGWMIPGLYFDYLRSEDARPLKNVFYHNAIDVLSMAALLDHMAGLLDDPFNRADHALDVVAIARLFGAMGQVETAIRLYEHGLAGDLPQKARWRTVRRLSFVHKRRDNLPAATALWRQAAGNGEVYAHVELAKFHEHRQHDYRTAAQWTEAAIALVKEPGYPRWERVRWLPELEHRLARVRRKLARAVGTRGASRPRPGGPAP